MTRVFFPTVFAGLQKKGRGKKQGSIGTPPSSFSFFCPAGLWRRCSSDKRNVNRPVPWNNNTRRWQADSWWQSLPLDWGDRRRGIKNEPAHVLRARPSAACACARPKTRAEKQIAQISACPNDISQTKAQNANTYAAEEKRKSKHHPTCAPYLCRLLFDQMQNTEKGLNCLQPPWCGIFLCIATDLLLMTGKYSGKARPHHSIPVLD